MTGLADSTRRVGIAVAAPAARHAGRVFRSVSRSSIQYHFDADNYLESMRQSVPRYDDLQRGLAEAARALDVHAVLDLGTGTGETAAAILDLYPDARLTGIDGSAQMLAVARRRLDQRQVEELRVGRLEDPLPPGTFDLAVSALAIHHLSPRKKRQLFGRVRTALRPGGRFVMADIVRPEQPSDAATPVSRVYDRPERASDLHAWLFEAGFTVSVPWAWKDLRVFAGDVPLSASDSAM